MLHILLFILALVAGGGDGVDGDGATRDGAVTAEASPPALQAEPQTPTGRFTTATEVRPILDMTRANWVAVRDYEGQDLLYLTHLLAWRCGLVRIEYGVNDEGLRDWPMPACHEDEAAPGALKPVDGLPYVAFPPGSVKTVQIRLTYDDLQVEEASFDRTGVEID